MSQPQSTTARPPAAGKGGLVTVAEIAAAKKLPVDFLKEERVGLRDTPGGVAIPYADTNGARQFVRVRDHIDLKKCTQTKLQPKGVPTAVYGAWRLNDVWDSKQRLRGRLFIVEGESNCWTLWYHHFAALGIPGANHVKKLTREHLEGVEVVYFIVDQKNGEPDQCGKQFQKDVPRHLRALDF